MCWTASSVKTGKNVPNPKNGMSGIPRFLQSLENFFENENRERIIKAIAGITKEFHKLKDRGMTITDTT